MLTFQVESWAQIVEEMRPIWQRHWEELALDQDKIGLNVNEQRYAWIESQGGLHIVTVRSEGRLVGYFLVTLLPHLHYKEAGLMGYTDVYYILPEFRQGGAGFRLIKMVERTLKRRGCSKFYLSCKVSQDHSELYEKMGFRLTDKVFTKLL